MFAHSKKTRVKKFKRHFDVRRIKSELTYTPSEIERALGVHKNTVLKWLRDGLKRIDTERPYLVYGQELVNFLRQKQQNRHQTCLPHEMFCVKCQKPQFVLNNAVDIEIYNQKQLIIRGICVTCQTKVNKLGSVNRLESYKKTFIVQTLQDRHIGESQNTSTICNKDKEQKNGL